MDLWKLLLLALVAVGVVLVLSQPPEPPRLPPGPRVEEGTYRVTTPQGAWEELFGVYPVDLGFRVVCLAHQGGRVLWEAELLYDPHWQPLAGALTRRAPEEVRYLYAFTGTEVQVRVQRGPRESARTLAVPEGTLLWEPEVLGAWYALLRAVPRAGSFPAFAGQALRTHTGRIDAGQEVQLRALGRVVPATRRELLLDGERFELFLQGDLLLGVRGARFSAHLVEVLPEGL